LGLLYFSPWGVVTLSFVDWLGLQSFVFDITKVISLKSPKKALSHMRNALLNKVMNFHQKVHPKYKIPMLSVFDWFNVVAGKFITSYSGSGERFMVKNSINNLLLGIYTPFFNGITADLAKLRPLLIGHDLSFETIMRASRLGSLLRDPKDTVFLSKPSLKGKETLRVPAI
jgi:hypothetical protein